MVYSYVKTLYIMCKLEKLFFFEKIFCFENRLHSCPIYLQQNKIRVYMKELICPKCGTIFKVDETDYKSIVDQVRNKEFEKELEVRMNELLLRKKAEQKLEIQKCLLWRSLMKKIRF